ncbi:MAG: FAD-dependent monooxygenase [Actinobacteria bacterium]|nr:FAD-dependent monooxygenase [Actinomycetota bacterium]
MASTPLTTDVVIVGAGPTGLMAATVLARLGVDHVIIDEKLEPTTESRAVGVQARTLEIYEQLGIVDEVLAEATKADALSPGYLKRAYANIPLPTLGAETTNYPYMSIIEQSKNEALLVRAHEALGGEVVWGRKVDAVESDGRGVLVSTGAVTGGEVSTGSTRLKAKYLIAADGAGSAVRRMRGIGFEGTTSAHTFFVVDAADVRGMRDTSVNIRLGRGEMLLAFPMGQGRDARLIGVVPGEHPEADLEAPLRAKLADTYGVTWGDTRWLSTYRVHHRVAERLRDGPVFLAGDAAHVHSPVGAQGMNTGLQDAHNLACKIADVLQGRADDAYLDAYEAERRPVAEHVIAFTERVFGLVTSDRRGVQTAIRMLVPIVAPVMGFLAPRLPLGRRVFGYVSQTRIRYRMPGADPRDSVVGRRLPPFAHNHDALRDFTWQVHTYGAVDRRLADAVGLPVHEYPAPVRGPLRAGWMYLVRPDGFVAAAGVTAAPLVAALPRRS